MAKNKNKNKNNKVSTRVRTRTRTIISRTTRERTTKKQGQEHEQ